MKFESLDRIYEHKKSVHRSLRQRILPLSNAQQVFRPSPDQWTISETAEHLSMVNSSILRLISSLLQKAEKAGGGPVSATIEITDGVEDSANGKIKTRPQYVPEGDVPMARSLEMINDADTQLIGLRPRFEQINLSAVSFPHWIFGPLTLGQWLAFVGVHEQRHLGQIEEVIASGGFPG